MNNIAKNILRFILLVVLQVLVFSNMNLSGYINPYIYILVILLLPFETPGWLLLLSGFVLGIVMDMFSGTMGLHTAATVFMAFCRPGVIRYLSAGKERDSGAGPNIKDMGLYWVISYSLILTALHLLLYFYLETFRLSEFFTTFARALLSILLTTLLIILSQLLFSRSNKRQ